MAGDKKSNFWGRLANRPGAGVNENGQSQISDGWLSKQRQKQGYQTGTQLPGYDTTPKWMKYLSPGAPGTAGQGAQLAKTADTISSIQQSVRDSGNDDLLSQAGVTDEQSRENALTRLEANKNSLYGASGFNPVFTGYNEAGSPTYHEPTFRTAGNGRLERASKEEGGTLVNPSWGYYETSSAPNYTLNADGTRSDGGVTIWSDPRMHGSKYQGMSFEDAVKMSGLLEQMGYDVDWDDMQTYAKALNDFQINGSQDDWYTWVNELSPFYSGYSDLTWDKENDLFDRDAFNDWWNANEEIYLDDILGSTDTSALRQFFGDSPITEEELSAYVFGNWAGPEGERYTVWDENRGDQAMSNILADIYDLEGDLNYGDIFGSDKYGVGQNYDALMSDLGRTFGQSMSSDPNFVGLSEKQMRDAVERYK